MRVAARVSRAHLRGVLPAPLLVADAPLEDVGVLRHDVVLTCELLISEVKKKNQNPKLSNSLNRSLRSKHTQDLLPTTQHLHTHEPTDAHPQEEE